MVGLGGYFATKPSHNSRFAYLKRTSLHAAAVATSFYVNVMRARKVGPKSRVVPSAAMLA